MASHRRPARLLVLVLLLCPAVTAPGQAVTPATDPAPETREMIERIRRPGSSADATGAKVSAGGWR